MNRNKQFESRGGNRNLEAISALLAMIFLALKIAAAAGNEPVADSTPRPASSHFEELARLN